MFFGQKTPVFLEEKKQQLNGMGDPLPLMQNALTFFNFFYPCSHSQGL